MCTYAKIACELFDEARKSTVPLDTMLFVIFFIPSIGAAAFSFGSSMLIRACVERADRLHAEKLAKLASAPQAKVMPIQATKKHRSR